MAIKSTKTSLRFANLGKRKQIKLFIDEYRLVMKKFIDIIWELDNPPRLLPKEITSQVSTWLSARATQCAAKQASGVVRGTKQKQSQRLYVYNNLLNDGKLKQARKLKSIIDKTSIYKPDINNIEPELDSRFVKQDWNNNTTYDGFVTLTSLGNKLKIIIPVKKSKHFNRLLNKGNIKSGIRLSKSNITFMFDLKDIPKRTTGKTIGLDIGILNTYSLSSGELSKDCNHGHNLSSIIKKISKKQKGSKAFVKAQLHRTNYINWAFNQLDLSNIKILKIESIKHMRKNKRTSRYLSHFTYTEIYSKINELALSNGVRLEKVNPVYTSQRCSCCGWVRSGNRIGKLFTCMVCKMSTDADVNAAKNIAANLRKITKQERLLHKNRKGFYLNEAGVKPIVSPTTKLV